MIIFFLHRYLYTTKYSLHVSHALGDGAREEDSDYEPEAREDKEPKKSKFSKPVKNRILKYISHQLYEH